MQVLSASVNCHILKHNTGREDGRMHMHTHRGEEREIHILSYSKQRLNKKLGITDTSFGVPYPCRILDTPRTLLHAYPSCVLYIYLEHG